MAQKGERRDSSGTLISRTRSSRFKFDHTAVVNRIMLFYRDGLQSRGMDYDARMQRNAKYRMWTAGKDWPWPDASDVGIPDIMTHSLRVQDTLHNAIMSARPVVSALAHKDEMRKKQEAVDTLIDYQVFVEQPGEEIFGDLIDSFVNESVYFAYIPWVREDREISEVKNFGKPEGEGSPSVNFPDILRNEYPTASSFQPRTADFWDWNVSLPGDEKLKVSFFTNEDGEIELITERNVRVYDGPRIIPKSYDDIFYPARSANLQMPGPSNPNGASHVLLRDFPTLDEVRRLRKSGFYDLVTDEQMKEIEAGVEASNTPKEDEAMKEQVDTFQNAKQVDPPPTAEAHRRLTRLMCFDIYDIDGDGIAEDVIWWVIAETKTILKAKRLTEMFPGTIPRRPVFSRSMIPVSGRIEGIGIPEMLEGIHDLFKTTIDQTIDNTAIEIAPFFFYRPFSGLKTERIRMSPGEGYPLSDPQKDIHFPSRQANSAAYGFNMMAIATQMQEKLTMVGDLQLGRVPAGRSSALRTVGGMQMVAGQGEARPERILRRLFSGLVEMWRHIYQMDRVFLSPNKIVRVNGTKSKEENPFITIENTTAIDGSFDFIFTANSFNTSKQALQTGLASLMELYISDIAIQMGIIDADGIYRLLRDAGKAFGQDPDQYLSQPQPGSIRQLIFAEDAISLILANRFPEGVPAEAGGYVEHHAKLMEFIQSDEVGLLDQGQPGGPQIKILQAYLQEVTLKAQEQRQQEAQISAAQTFQSGRQGTPGPNVQQQPNMQQPQISGGNELLDESLPGAGGGAVQ